MTLNISSTANLPMSEPAGGGAGGAAAGLMSSACGLMCASSSAPSRGPCPLTWPRLTRGGLRGLYRLSSSDKIVMYLSS
jgi:hypothetical protein